MTPLLSLVDVCFAYGKSQDKALVIEGLSLSVKEGEFLAIMGPSGSGKSTILALIAGLKRPQAGQVLFQGRNVADFSEGERADYLNHDVGMVYQFFNLIPDLSALDNAAMPAIIGGMKKTVAREKAELFLREMGLEKKIKAKAAKLSGGQQQRVAIARAFINEPKVILADEPTGNLDRAATESVMEMLCEERQRRNTALVVVTHDKEVALLADSILEL
jgi:lipoprotein-releasing system ATP-binding protein